MQPKFHGMVPVEGGRLTSLQPMAFRWPARLKLAAAVCNSLKSIAKHQVVGDVADQQACQAVEAHFLVIKLRIFSHLLTGKSETNQHKTCFSLTENHMPCKESCLWYLGR